MAVPRGPALRPVRPRARGRDHPRAAVPSQLHQELPYSITVETEGWAEARGRQRGADRPDDLRRCATARSRSCSARAASSSRRSARRRAQELERLLDTPRPPVPVRQGARELARRPRALPRDGARLRALSSGPPSAANGLQQGAANGPLVRQPHRPRPAGPCRPSPTIAGESPRARGLPDNDRVNTPTTCRPGAA